MKQKYTNLFLAVLLTFPFLLSAREVPFSKAQAVAENFFKQQSGYESATALLKYSSVNVNGAPLYFVFDFKDRTGFVIVNAEDAGSPILAYSVEDNFKKPDPKSNIGQWLALREKEINYLKENMLRSTEKVLSQWESYSNFKQANKSSQVNTVAPLLETRWNQSPFYNDSCPGLSVTGCVATTMAQIMKYWSYPLQGTGSSSYCNCWAAGYSNDYGILSANYATNYNWNNMPNVVSAPNADVAKIMYHCGVSVEMNYDPSGSGAWVIKADNFISAENSFAAYFGYDPNTISGVYRGNYSDAAWLTKLKGDLDLGRPLQYAGFGNAGGHTWVCDGYDQNDFFHMNWGWGGSANGYFNIDVLNPNGMDFSGGQQCLFGIIPYATNAIDASAVSLTQLNNCSDIFYSPSVKVRNFGISNLNSCVISYKLDNGPVQTINWSGSLQTGQAVNLALANYTLTSGSHTLTCYTGNPNNQVDGNLTNDQVVYTFRVFPPFNLPLNEGFETPANTANHWSVLPSANGSNWTVSSQAFSSGANSAMIDNMNNTAGNVSVMQGVNDFDLSNSDEPHISFKVAYQQRSVSNDDKLSLEISNDCGKTWWTRWSKHGSALATAAPEPNMPYVPSQASFVRYIVPAQIASNVIFRWVFIADANGAGNNIYLDDINLFDNSVDTTSAVGIKENKIAGANTFELFPNPSNGETYLALNLATDASAKIDVTDIYGKEIISISESFFKAGEQKVWLNKNAFLNKGIYFVSVLCNGIKTTKKLVIN